MTKIPGKLMVDLFPDGTVRLVFLPTVPLGNACPVRSKDLDAAEALFVECGLSAELAAALRNELERHKVASVETSVDEEVAAKFRYTKPDYKDRGTPHDDPTSKEG
jgi:hypothetical protein